MKVLIIGGSGYIGSYAAFYLGELGWDVTVFDKKDYPGPATFIHGDITHTKAVLAAGYDADCIVILAGLVGDPACEADPLKANETNNIAVKNICDAFSKKHIILFSSCSVYGAQDSLLHEDSPTGPISVYARTKLAAEAHITGIGGTIFRLGSVYGVGNLSEVRVDSIVNMFVRDAIYKGAIKIMGGSQWKSLISITDVVGFLADAIGTNIRGLYNISDRNYTVRHIAQKVRSCLPRTEVIMLPPLENDRNYRIDNRKMLSDFNYYVKENIVGEIFKLATYFRMQLRRQSNV